MLKTKKYPILSILISLTLLLSACGNSTAEEASIATAVALTVAARNTQPATETPIPLPTLTTTPPAFFPTLTPSITKAPPTSSVNGNTACAKANWVSDTPPDGTIMKPGAQFTKIWRITNSSSCTWDTSYKIVYWGGEIMGGGYEYNFPQSAAPGQTVDVPIMFTAPAVDGTYESQWMLKTPDGITFGVGDYSVPITAKIVVSASAKPGYGITSVTYQIVRDPAAGCTANVNHIVSATITVSGPLEFKYRWMQSDGNNSGPKTIKFDSAGSITLEREWKLHLGSATNDRWMQIVVVEPFTQEYDKAVFSYTCK
jgi:hypothetical protein